MVLPLIADAPLDDASRAFNDIEHGFFAILAVRGFDSLLYIRPHFQHPTVLVNVSSLALPPIVSKFVSQSVSQSVSKSVSRF